ncbi:hypothetical protein Hte_006268 [Hypoxylon texense]
MSTIDAVPFMTLPPTFDPVPSCTQDIYYIVAQDISCVDGNGNVVACRYFHLGPTTSTSDCFPTTWTPTPGAYISPGACPRGYTVACAQTQVGGPETMATCCPNSYSCQTDSTAWPWYSTDLCVQPMADTITYFYTTRTPGKDFETASTTGGGEINAFGVVIRWQASDLIKSTATTSTSTQAAQTSTSTRASMVPSSSVLTSSTIDTSVSSDPRGLSVGARAGIGIGVAAAFVIILAAIFILWRTRRKKNGERIGPDDTLPGGTSMPAMTLLELSNGTETTSFGYQTGWSELPGRREPAELWAGTGK